MAGSTPHPHYDPETSRRPEDLYASPPPWDIGRPRSRRFSPSPRPVPSAAGCWTRAAEPVSTRCWRGSRSGRDGVDLASNALRVAEAKARDRGRPARFMLHDARRLADLHERFDTVLDCGLFHIFDGDDRAAYVDGLRCVLPVGGRCFILAFSDRQPGEWGHVHRLTRGEIEAAFADGWRIDSIEPATLDITTDPGIQAWLVALTRI